MGKGRFEPSAP